MQVVHCACRHMSQHGILRAEMILAGGEMVELWRHTAMRIARAATLGVALALTGCAQSQLSLPSPTDAVRPEKASLGPPAAPVETRLERGDKIRVTVFNESQLSGEYIVEGQGTIGYPLLGQVPVAGLTAREVEQALIQRLSGRFLVNPKLSVEILSQRPFYILGEIARPGEYPFRPGLNVVSAVALAGGFGPRAAVSSVTIRRAASGQEQQVPVTPDVPIHPGDLITVSERYF